MSLSSSEWDLITLNANTIKLEFAERMRKFQSSDFQFKTSKKDKIEYKKQLELDIDQARIPLMKILKLNLEDFHYSLQLQAIPKKLSNISMDKVRFDRKSFLAKAKKAVLLALRSNPELDVAKHASQLKNVA
jgi:hypothetical protein